jgi:hypothetical protein
MVDLDQRLITLFAATRHCSSLAKEKPRHGGGPGLRVPFGGNL